MQAFERERRPSTVADESLDARPVLGLDVHGGVDAEPARALPVQHTGGIEVVEESLAPEVAEELFDGGGKGLVFPTNQPVVGSGYVQIGDGDSQDLKGWQAPVGVSTADQIVKIEFGNGQGCSNFGFSPTEGECYVASVPEPSTYLLMLTGVLGLG